MSTRRLRNSVVCLPLAVLVPVVAVLLCAEQASAQRAPYSTFEISKVLSAQNNLTRQQTAMLDKYFDEFFLGLFNKPGRPDDLPNLRNKIYKIVVKNAGKTAAHDYLNKKLLKAMVGILGGSGDKAIKYNAMLMIAELNESDANRNIKPLPEALRYLTYVAYTDNQAMDYLKPAALIGLQRFAEERAIPADQVAQATQKLLEIVQQKDPPAGRSASAHNYLRRGAAGVLAAMGNTGPDNGVILAFEAIAANPQARPSLRCEMARYIGELNYPPESKIDLKRVANILGHQTVEISNKQLGRGDDEAAGAVIRRMTMYVLESCTEGLQKLVAATENDKESRDFIIDLKRKMDGLYRQLDDIEKTKDGDVAGLVESAIGEIEAMLPAKPQPAARAAADSVDDAAKQANTN